MTTQISSKVLAALGATLQEDSWNGTPNNALDNASVDRVDYNGQTYNFSANDFYSDDALETKLESIFGGSIDIVSDTGGGWGSNGSTFKYLVFQDSWWNKTVLIDANGKSVTTSAPTRPTTTPAPKKPSGSSSDNYD